MSTAITPNSGNVFADLGLLEKRRLSQTQAAERLGINQPRISAVARYRLEWFSVERLMLNFLSVLGRGRRDRQINRILPRADHRSRALSGRISHLINYLQPNTS